MSSVCVASLMTSGHFIHSSLLILILNSCISKDSARVVFICVQTIASGRNWLLECFMYIQ